MNNIAQRIENVCHAKRLNYKQLAEQLGVAPQSIYQIVNGKNSNPTVAFIEKFQQIGINPAWLITGEGSMMKEEKVLKKETEHGVISMEYLMEQIKQKDSLIQTLQRIIDSQLISLGKWLDVSCSRFVFFYAL